MDSIRYKMIFKDKNGIYSNTTLLKSELNKAEYIIIDCKYVSRYINPFKFQTKNYDFFKLNDTLLKEKVYSAYKLAIN